MLAGVVRTQRLKRKVIPSNRSGLQGITQIVGGSYAENESRLSDISLQWMLEAAVQTVRNFI